MFRIIAIAAFLWGSESIADDLVERRPPARCREECRSVLVRINTYRVTRVREWDGYVYEYRTLIGVRYERELWCERRCPRIWIQDE